MLIAQFIQTLVSVINARTVTFAGNIAIDDRRVSILSEQLTAENILHKEIGQIECAENDRYWRAESSYFEK